MGTSEPALEFSSFADVYERLLVPSLFRPWAELLVGRMAPKDGDRVLDVACGTGIVARLMKERVGSQGRVVGVDQNPQMLRVAAGVEQGVEWREGNAGSLPVPPDELFDIVTCQQGLQFFPDRAAAVGEMRRVLAPGGRLGIATWSPLNEMPFLLELQRRVEAHVGPVVDVRHGFGDDRALATLLVDTGFNEVQVETLSLPMRFEDWTVYVRLNAAALVGMSAKGRQMGDEERNRTISAIVQESESTVAGHRQGQALTFELRSNLATARG